MSTKREWPRSERSPSPFHPTTSYYLPGPSLCQQMTPVVAAPLGQRHPIFTPGGLQPSHLSYSTTGRKYPRGSTDAGGGETHETASSRGSSDCEPLSLKTTYRGRCAVGSISQVNRHRWGGLGGKRKRVKLMKFQNLEHGN